MVEGISNGTKGKETEGIRNGTSDEGVGGGIDTGYGGGITRI